MSSISVVSSLQKSRTRLVNFRLTEEEFHRLKIAAALQGARCMSDFLRLLALGGVRTAGLVPQDNVNPDERLASLERRTAGLEYQLAHVMHLLDPIRPAGRVKQES